MVLLLRVAAQATSVMFRNAIGATYDTPYNVLWTGVTKHSSANRAIGDKCVSVSATQ